VAAAPGSGAQALGDNRPVQRHSVGCGERRGPPQEMTAGSVWGRSPSHQEQHEAIKTFVLVN